jgi:hypothetical protein
VIWRQNRRGIKSHPLNFSVLKSKASPFHPPSIICEMEKGEVKKIIPKAAIKTKMKKTA